MGLHVAPLSFDLNIWPSGHQEFNAATMIVPGRCKSTASPPKPNVSELPETGVISVQALEVMLYFQTAPRLPSKGPDPFDSEI